MVDTEVLVLLPKDTVMARQPGIRPKHNPLILIFQNWDQISWSHIKQKEKILSKPYVLSVPQKGHKWLGQLYPIISSVVGLIVDRILTGSILNYAARVWGITAPSYIKYFQNKRPKTMQKLLWMAATKSLRRDRKMGTILEFIRRLAMHIYIGCLENSIPTNRSLWPDSRDTFETPYTCRIPT